MPWFAGVCLMVAIAFSSATTPCPYKECVCSGTTFINCNSKSLTSMPQMQPGSWGQIDLDMSGNNALTTIDPAQLPASLEVITIQNSPITAIGNLTGLTKLKSMMIQFTKIGASSRPPNHIGPLPASLKSLSLRFCEFGMKPIIYGADSLEHLDLDGNKFVSSIGIYYWRSTLKELSLALNKITFIDDFNFDNGPSSLQRIDFSNNPITRINDKAFAQLGQLRELNLGGVKLTRLPLALARLTSLDSLTISGDNLDCTCDEAALGSWASSRPSLKVSGRCMGTRVSTVETFLRTIAPQCPSQVVG